MNQDQEVPATVGELSRLGSLFGTALGPHCYQHSETYKSAISSGPFPADWREAWHQEGNSCETDDSEQYVPDTDFQSTSVNGMFLQ
ncbi:hypothetical protein Trydic_g6095 [Trypoxylus dichotomus]